MRVWDAKRTWEAYEAIRLYAQGVVADRVRPEARESLLKLIKADTIETHLQAARKDDQSGFGRIGGLNMKKRTPQEKKALSYGGRSALRIAVRPKTEE